jgi:subtilisin family serine protease
MEPLDLVKLQALMKRTSGSPEVKIGLIDGRIATLHPELESEHLRELPGNRGTSCTRTHNFSCQHGTFIAGILSAKRSSQAPAICPDCTLIVRPIFEEATDDGETVPSATPKELAIAILECIDAGARVINLSLALTPPYKESEQSLGEALDHAARRGVVVEAAAGNQGALGRSAITGHPGVIPVVACDADGRRVPVALLGKVFCCVEASGGPIDIGDLLTTGTSAGCAMRATDPLSSHGAILGKALCAHTTSAGIIPILVALQ